MKTSHNVYQTHLEEEVKTKSVRERESGFMSALKSLNKISAVQKLKISHNSTIIK